KDEFLATVSHELRTPLNAILGWTHMLRTGAVEPKALPRVLETIERNARAQSQLVEDILDVSRIIAGKLRVNIQRTDLHAVARPTRSRTSSIGSGRRTARSRARRAGWASAWRSCATWSKCTAGWSAPAPRAKARERRSPCRCRCARSRLLRRSRPWRRTAWNP